LCTSDLVANLFGQELRRRGVQCRFDAEERRYRLQYRGRELLVSLDNVTRDYDRERDNGCVASFIDNLLSRYVEEQSWEEVRSSILFTLEPSDYAEPLPLRTPISERVDKVAGGRPHRTHLVHHTGVGQQLAGFAC